MTKTLTQLSKATGFDEKTLYETILKHSNATGEKIMHYDETFLVQKEFYTNFTRRREQNELLELNELEEKRQWELPIKPKAVVYFLFENDCLVYIGQSVNVLSRLKDHARLKSFDSIALVECERHALNEVEALYIDKYKPTLNIAMPSEKDLIKYILRK